MFGFDTQALPAAWIPVLGQSEGAMKVVAEGKSDFQPYIFWAYGLACLLLLLFSAWTVSQVRGLDQRVHHLRSRFDDAHGERSEPAAPESTG